LESTAQTNSRRLGLPALIGVVVSVLGVWYALHDISLSELLAVSKQVRIAPFLAAVALVTLTFPLRTIRWRYLLQMDGKKLPFGLLWHSTAIGFMANNILPARAGEVARIYSAGKLTGVSYSASFASIAIERVFDGLIILLLMAGALSFAQLPGDVAVEGVALAGVAKTVSVLFLALLGFSMFAVHKPEVGLNIADRVSHSILPDRLADKAMGIARGLLAGLDSLKDPRRFLAILFWSLVVWVTNAVSFWVAFMAFDIDVPLSGAFILQAVVAFGVSLPQAPGYIGVYEAAIKGTLVLFAVEATRSVSYALLLHIGGFIPITVLGFISLARARFSLADLTKGPEQVS
jgi:uncharacterized protein (TIRG00374 family)